MKTTFCILVSIVTVYCLPNPESYKDSGISATGSDSYDKDTVKRSFSSFDFESPSKLEYSETSAVAGHSDVGPKDVAAELHAKIEEAAQHALAIIDGAKTFAEEAEKEQVIFCTIIGLKGLGLGFIRTLDIKHRIIYSFLFSFHRLPDKNK